MSKSKASTESPKARNQRFEDVLYSCIDFSFDRKERTAAKKWFGRQMAICRAYEDNRLVSPKQLFGAINQVTKMIDRNPALRARAEANPNITIRELTSKKKADRSIPDKKIVRRRHSTQGFI
jgi:hypothetical protein